VEVQFDPTSAEYAGVGTSLAEAIPDSAELAVAQELWGECVEGGSESPAAETIKTDIAAAVEATETLEQLVADSEAVTATVTQALQTTGTAQAAVTETVTQVQGTVGEVQTLLAEGATLADPRVEALLGELASTLTEAGVNPEAFGALEGAAGSDFLSAMAEHGDVFAAAIETHVAAEMREALASGGGPPSPEQMREFMDMAAVAGVNFESVMTETFQEHFGGGQEMGFGAPGGTMDFEAMAAAGVISQADLESIQAGFQAMEQGFEQMHVEMMAAAEQYGGMAGFEASFAGQFETMAMEMGAQGMTPEQIGAAMEHMGAELAGNAAEAAASFYASNSDTSAAGSSGYVAPSSGGGGGGGGGVEVLVATHDHDGNFMPDEYHYDTNGDGIADHAHSTPH
jgi:hypothetical protein